MFFEVKPSEEFSILGLNVNMSRRMVSDEPSDDEPASTYASHECFRLPAVADVDDVAVFDDVVFAFEQEAAGLFEFHFSGVAGRAGGD